VSRTLQSECNVNTPMTVSPKTLQSLQQFKAHTLPFDVRFLHRPHPLANTSTTCKTHIHNFSVKKLKEQRQKYLEFAVPVCRVFLVSNSTFLFWSTPITKTIVWIS